MRFRRYRELQIMKVHPVCETTARCNEDEDLRENMRMIVFQYDNVILCNNFLIFSYRCHEAEGVTALAATREHVQTVLWIRRMSINADVSIMRVHRARERTGKSRRPLNRAILLSLSSTTHDSFHF